MTKEAPNPKELDVSEVFEKNTLERDKDGHIISINGKPFGKPLFSGALGKSTEELKQEIKEYREKYRAFMEAQKAKTASKRQPVPIEKENQPSESVNI